jgi:TonB family protein
VWQKWSALPAQYAAGKGCVAEKAELVGFCTQSDIYIGVGRGFESVSGCYQEALERDPNIKGDVVISWAITLDGKVADVSIASTNLGSRRLERCMVKAIEGWMFPPPSGGICRVTYPFRLAPE